MGRKYIIELEDKNVWECGYPDRTLSLDMTVLGKALTNVNTGIPLTPYTEPDIEQVRKEWYQHGLNDAREGKASCQFCEYEMCSDRVDPCRICACNYTNFFEPKKQGKEEQITKGDIVLIKSTPEVEILATYADEEYVSGIALTEVDGNCEIGDQYTNIRISNVEKTGKHYDIVSVLAKMKEADNG